MKSPTHLFSGVGAATRISRRDMLRSRLRWFITIVLIAVPIAIGIGGSAILESHNLASGFYQPTRTIEVDSMTCADAQSSQVCDETASTGQMRSAMAAALPAGFSVTPLVSYDAGLSKASASAPTIADTVFLDNQELSAIRPAEGSILLAADSATRLQASVGDKLRLTVRPCVEALTVTVQAISPAYYSVVNAPGIPVEPGSRWASTQWVINGPRALTNEEIATASEKGFMVFDDPTLESPQNLIAAGFDALINGKITWEDLGVNLVIALDMLSGGGLIIVLLSALITPVFALLTTRNARLFATLAAQGASPRHITYAVMAYGFVTGVVATVIGAVVGYLGAFAWWASTYPDYTFYSPWWLWAGIVSTAIVCCTLATAWPARLAARAPLARGIQGAQIDRVTRWRGWMAAGPIVLVAAFILAVITWDPYRTMTLVLFLAACGAIASAPALCLGLAWLTRRVGTPSRLAGQGLMRQSSRSIPVVAGLLGIAMAAGAFGTFEANSDSVDPPEVAYLQGPPGADLEAAAQVITAQHPGTIHEVRDFPLAGTDGALPPGTLAYDISGDFNQQCDTCGTDFTWYTGFVQANPDDVALWDFDNPGDERAAQEALAAGGIVAAKGSQSSPRIDITAKAYRVNDLGIASLSRENEVSSRTRTLEVTEALPANNGDTWLLSKSAARELGLESTELWVAIDFDKAPTAWDVRDIRSILTDNGFDPYMISYNNQPISSPVSTSAGVFAVLAIVLLVGLAVINFPAVRRETAQLLTIGAPPGLSRGIAARQIALITLALPLGVVLGQLLMLIRSELAASLDWWTLGASLIAAAIAIITTWVIHTLAARTPQLVSTPDTRILA